MTSPLPDVGDSRARLSVFGLGYVGCVSAACLAARGHPVVGVDVNPEKAALLRAGRAPVVEDDIAEVVCDVVASGALTVIDDPVQAVLTTDATLVCVGTPSGPGGALAPGTWNG